MLRGDDVGLASGAMFAGAKEGTRVAREKKKQFVDLMKATLERKGLEFSHEYHVQHTVHVLTIMHEGVQHRRSFFDGDIISRNPRDFLIQQLYELFGDMGVEFNKEDVKLADEIEFKVPVDDAGTPPAVPTAFGGQKQMPQPDAVPAPDSAYDDYADAVPVSETDEDNLGQTVGSVEEADPLQELTIRQLRDYGRDHGAVVPSDVKLKNDIVDYLNEHTDGS